MGRRPAYFLLCLASLLSCGFLFRFVDEYGALKRPTTNRNLAKLRMD